jgi:hypothetical protein
LKANVDLPIQPKVEEEEEKEVGDLIELKTDLQIFMEKHQQEIEVNPKKRKQIT